MTGLRILKTSAFFLAILFAFQLYVVNNTEIKNHAFAIWKDSPKTLAKVKELSDHIIIGKIRKIERGEDLVVKVEGEPNNEVRIPVEVITITVEKTLKGTRKNSIKLFHTGLSIGKPVTQQPSPRGPAPPKPEGGTKRPSKLPIPKTEEEARTVMLHDDPGYKVGERYTLFLRDGPTIKLGGNLVPTKAIISPEGRYRIKPDNKIEPMTKRGFSGGLKDIQLDRFEKLIIRTNPIRPDIIR